MEAASNNPKYHVSARALLQRVNRKLAHDDERVCKTRGYYDRNGEGPYFDHNLGEYHRIDVLRNSIVATHVDLEQIGREMGVVAEWEAVEE